VLNQYIQNSRYPRNKVPNAILSKNYQRITSICKSDHIKKTRTEQQIQARKATQYEQEVTPGLKQDRIHRQWPRKIPSWPPVHPRKPPRNNHTRRWPHSRRKQDRVWNSWRGKRTRIHRTTPGTDPLLRWVAVRTRLGLRIAREPMWEWDRKRGDGRERKTW
jgi:hypothetical protein